MALLIVNELGVFLGRFPPVRRDARLLVSLVSQVYETQSVVFTTSLPILSSQSGGRCSETTRWRRRSSTRWFTTAGSCASGASPIACGTRSCRAVLNKRARFRCEDRSKTGAIIVQWLLTKHTIEASPEFADRMEAT